MDKDTGTTEKRGGLEGEVSTALQQAADTLPATEFVKVEKNLASLGFFTPSSKRLRNAQEKSFTITTVVDGKRIELKGTIIPSAKYGLPITADQDKWIALGEILTDVMKKEGKVTNPIAFTSADILRLLHQHRHSGKNYKEVEEWLDVLFSTTIFSEGVVYLASEKRRVKDRFRVFDRVVSFGKELSDGKVADKNYVWFSEWQLQNINSNHLLPIDLAAYRELKNHIAKALVPLLQIWLYATRDEGVFEKRYDELCQFLNIQRYRYRSLITRTLGPSLDELKQFGYLADWQIEKTSDRESYKIVFYHGEKFHRDRRARLSRNRPPNGADEHHALTDRTNGGSVPGQRDLKIETPAPQPTFDPQLVAEFTRRGVTAKKALELLANLKPGQDVIAQLEHAEQSVQHSQIPITNPAGFIVRLIEWNTPVPDGFETSAKRKAREERERRDREQRAADEAEQQLDGEYEAYRDAEVDRYIAANTAAFEALKGAKWKEDRERYSFTTESMAKMAARFEIQKQLPLLTFEEFLVRKRQGADFLLKPVAVLADAETFPVAAPHEDIVMTDDAVIPPDADPAAADSGEEMWPEPRPAMQPATPEAGIDEPPPVSAEPPTIPGPVIELASDPLEHHAGSNDPPSLFA